MVINIPQVVRQLQTDWITRVITYTDRQTKSTILETTYRQFLTILLHCMLRNFFNIPLYATIFHYIPLYIHYIPLHIHKHSPDRLKNKLTLILGIIVGKFSLQLT